MNKQGKTNISPWAIVGVIALILFLVGQNGGVGDILSGITGPDGTTDGTLVDGGVIITDGGVTMTAGPMDDRYVPGTSVTGYNITLIRNGVLSDNGMTITGGVTSVLTDGNAGTSLAPGENFCLIYGQNNSVYEGIAECYITPASDFASAILTDSGSHKIAAREASPSFTVFNGDNNQLSDGTGSQGNETISANGEGSWDIDIERTSDTVIAFGPTVSVSGKYLVACELNKTNFDVLKTTFSGGVRTGNPDYLTVSATDKQYVSFEVTGKKTAGGETAHTLRVEADSTDPANSGDDGCGIYYYNWARDPNSGNWEYSHEDSDGNYVGGVDNSSFIIFYQ